MRSGPLRPKLVAQFSELAGALATPNCERHLVYLIPVPVARLARSGALLICRKDVAMAVAIGRSAVDKGYFFGYKLHIVTCLKGVFRHMDITPGNVHDIRFIKSFGAENPSTGKELVADRA